MKIKLSTVFLLFCLFASSSENGQYGNPLKEVTYCTSSFGEYRSNHFHGGVDFSTQGEEGHPVLAVGDGVIRRVRREAVGYGRVIYLDLNDGRSAVYGHLIRFSRELSIEQKLQLECKKKGTSFPGDIIFDPPIKVKKGDVIGFSGQLGIGSPHLHLEIRRGDELRDPFYEGIPLIGMAKPKIEEIYIVPKNEGAKVDSSFFPKRKEIVQSKNGDLTLSSDVVISGKNDIYLSIYDEMGSKTYKTFPSEVKGEIDGQEFFYLNFKGVSLSQYKKSPFLFDTIQGKVFLVLRKDPDIILDEIRGDGLPILNSRHKITITVSNRSNQKTTLSFDVEFENKEEKIQKLPFDNFTIEKEEIFKNGVGLLIKPLSNKGETKILLEDKETPFFGNNTKDGKWEVLIPKSSFMGRLTKIKIGENLLPCLYTSQNDFEIGRFIVEVPKEVLCKIKPSSNSIDIDLSPEGMRPFVKLGGYLKEKPKEAIFTNSYFFSHLGGKTKGLFKNRRYEIKEDKNPPQFVKVFKRTIQNIKEEELSLIVKDDLSYINAETMKIYIDDERVYPDWDSDESSIRIDLTDIKKGEHFVSGFVQDVMGNLASLPKTKFLR
jgi:hypothetical protein